MLKKYDLKIGILINDLDSCSDWELHVINKIIGHRKLTLELFILDGRNADKHKAVRPKRTPGRILFGMQVFLERKLLKNYIISGWEKTINTSAKIKTIYVRPQRKGVIDLLTDEDANHIRKHDLDLIIKLGFDIIEGPVNDLAKHGIWALNHSGSSIYPVPVAGFREMALKQSAVCVSLEQLTANAEKGLLIDKAYFNRHWSFVATNARILEASVSLLFKNIDRLLSGDDTSKTVVNIHKLSYTYPGLWHVLKYALGFYFRVMSILLANINFRLFGIRIECWTLFIGEGDFSSSMLSKLNPVTLAKKEFWADPFIFNYKNINYIFFENFSYASQRGKISCGRIENNDLVDIRDVLELDCHLSFPNIFEEDNEIYLMPEMAENKRLEIYRCVSFPDKWELYSTAFEGEEVYDPVLHTDENGMKWLFINKRPTVNAEENNELHIYQVDSIKFRKIIPHAQNPVIIDARTARNAGPIFKKDGKLYRPSQANIDGIYGRALNMNTIDKLTIDDYQETKIETIIPDFHKGLMSTHHFHQINHLFVIDAAFKRK